MSLKGYPMLGNPALGNIKFIKIRFLFCNIFTGFLLIKSCSGSLTI
jgi:hypothetical protein